MDIQNRYDELDNLLSTIDVLIDEIESKDIIDDLEYIKYNYMGEKEDLEKELAKMQEQEEKELENEYIRSVL